MEMSAELISVEIFEAFVVFLTEESEASDSELGGFFFGVALIDERDSVLHREVEDRCNVIWLHNGLLSVYGTWLWA